MASVSIQTVINKLQARIEGYNLAINFHQDSDSASTQKRVAEYRAIVAELEILKENFEDTKYKIELGL
jgi:uncharacterized protein YlxW (UPF0749 family)